MNIIHSRRSIAFVWILLDEMNVFCLFNNVKEVCLMDNEKTRATHAATTCGLREVGTDDVSIAMGSRGTFQNGKMVGRLLRSYRAPGKGLYVVERNVYLAVSGCCLEKHAYLFRGLCTEIG